MKAFLLRRMIFAVVTLFLVTVSVFFVLRLLPGDPLLVYLSRSADLDVISEDQLDQLRREHGLDKPIHIQYVNWISNVARGDFGSSIF